MQDTMLRPTVEIRRILTFSGAECHLVNRVKWFAKVNEAGKGVSFPKHLREHDSVKAMSDSLG